MFFAKVTKKTVHSSQLFKWVKSNFCVLTGYALNKLFFFVPNANLTYLRLNICRYGVSTQYLHFLWIKLVHKNVFVKIRAEVYTSINFYLLLFPHINWIIMQIHFNTTTLINIHSYVYVYIFLCNWT